MELLTTAILLAVIPIPTTIITTAEALTSVEDADEDEGKASTTARTMRILALLVYSLY